ncbi:MAG: hypothetical protein WA961_04310 [Rhodanobacter sp.]
MKRALLAGWRRQAGLCPGVAPGANKANSSGIYGRRVRPCAASAAPSKENLMEITINVPTWMARDLAADTESKEFTAEIVERAMLAYYKELYDPLTGQRTKVHLGGNF